ncbi:ArsR/SmtB family transcription factor [Pseudogemmobacter bohemicus]|uniref:ArsR/SmtB family transcription factor n=1 Tax=Pseudogemmobacter bohemicus TaxID=2250708 RepID=UPI000DD4521F|nr:helix-turn-helix domain-containing protein [Pseudogemmobacter bohemicus]
MDQSKDPAPLKIPDDDAGLPRSVCDPVARARALRAFAALSHGDRLDLIRLLLPSGPDGLAAGEIARLLGLSASRLSFHLSQLEQAGLLTARRVARNVFYAVDPAGLGAAISHLLNDCCGEHPEVIACCQGAGAPAVRAELSGPES